MDEAPVREPEDDDVVETIVIPVETYTIPCLGGPLNQLKVSEPFPTTIPCSDGQYVLVYQATYEYEREGRKPVGHRADD